MSTPPEGRAVLTPHGPSVAVHPLWLFPLATLLLMCWFVAPRRGAEWNEDDGYFLMRSWMAAHGFGLDRLAPHDPCYLVNALLMEAGVSAVLRFRQIGHLLTFASASVFFVSLDGRGLGSGLVPLAVGASLLVSLTSVSTPASLSLAFFMVGAGGIFRAMEATGRAQAALASLAGLSLALAGFMHAAVGIGMVCVVALALWLDPRLRHGSLGPTFGLAIAVLWGTYALAVGPDALASAPPGHDGSPRHLISRLVLLARHLGEPVVAFAAVSIVLRAFGNRAFTMAQVLLGLVVTAFYGLTLIRYLQALPPPPPWLPFGRIVYFLTGVGQYVERIPGAAAYLFVFAALRSFADIWCRAESRGLGSRVEALLRGAPGRRKLTLAVAGFSLIGWALAVGSLSDVFQNFAFLGGCLIGFAIVADGPGLAAVPIPRAARIVPILWLGLLLGFTLGYNHSTNGSLFAADRVEIEGGVLRGIHASRRYVDATTRLVEAHRARGGAGLPLVVLDYLPTVHLLLERPLPAFGLVRPAYYFPETRIRGELDPDRGWFVVDATGPETQDWVADRGADIRAPLRAWIAANSDPPVELTGPSAQLPHLTLYFRRPRR